MKPKPKIYKDCQGGWVCAYQDMLGIKFQYFYTWRSAISWCSAALYDQSMGEYKVVRG